MIDLILERTIAKIEKIFDNTPEELLSRNNFMKRNRCNRNLCIHQFAHLQGVVQTVHV